MRGNYSVVQFFEDDSNETVRSRVGAHEAAEAVRHYCNSVGARLGFTKRVIITDLEDIITFEWKHGEGIVFPPELKGIFK
jgi:hypothetical protein